MRDNYLSVNFIIYAMNKRRALICLTLSIIPFITFLATAVHAMSQSYGKIDYLNALFVATIIGGPMSLVVFYVCYTFKPPKPKPMSKEMKVLLKEHPELVMMHNFLASMAMFSFAYLLVLLFTSMVTGCPWGFVPLWLYYKMLFVLLSFYLYGLAGTVFSAHYARVLVNDRMRILWGIFTTVVSFIFLIALMEVLDKITKYEDSFRYIGAAALSLFIFGVGLIVAIAYVNSRIKKME